MIDKDVFEDLFVLEMANNHLGSVERGLNACETSNSGRHCCPQAGDFILSVESMVCDSSDTSSSPRHRVPTRRFSFIKASS